MKPYVILLAAALAGQSAHAQGPLSEDILIYRFSRTRNWQQHEAAQNRNGVLRGRNLLTGIAKDDAYWIFDRENNKITELRYYKTFVDGVPQKLYEVNEGTFSKLEENPIAYDDDASGDSDQLMDIMFLPTTKANVLMQTCRDSFVYFDPISSSNYRSGHVWDLTGPTRIMPGLGAVASSLTGFYQASLNNKSVNSNNEMLSFTSRVDAGPQSATYESRLTTRARTVDVNGNTMNTMENAIEIVSQLLESLGYDYFDFYFEL
jgi:hypothetical protein